MCTNFIGISNAHNSPPSHGGKSCRQKEALILIIAEAICETVWQLISVKTADCSDLIKAGMINYASELISYENVAPGSELDVCDRSEPIETNIRGHEYRPFIDKCGIGVDHRNYRLIHEILMRT